MKVLIIEDDPKIRSFVTKGLQQAGFAVDTAKDGVDGLHLALNEPYDAAIVDVMLPGMDGLSLIRELRKQKIDLPIIILSAKRSVEDRIKGLETGSDDYLIKPFSFSELLARLHALIRRASHVPSSTVLSVHDLSVDLVRHKAVRGNFEIDLQPRELRLLEYLMRNVGRPVSKTMIMEHVWEYDFNPQTNVVDVLVCRLRNKVDKDFTVKLIHTLRGVGYVLK